MKCPGAWAGLNGGRYLLQGTTENIGPGVNMVGKGNASGLCNYIGVDSGATVCNVNGGTLWCYKGDGAGDLGIGINGTKLHLGQRHARGGGLSLGELSGGNGTFWQTDGVVTNYGVCFVGNGTFSGVPSLDVKGCSIRLTSDRKRVVVVRNGMTIIVR